MATTSRTAGLAGAALAASLLFTGCGGEGAATPPGGGGDSAGQEQMQETNTPMRGNEQGMREGEGDSMTDKERQRMQRGEHEPMTGDDRRDMRSGEHEPMNGRDGQDGHMNGGGDERPM